MIPTDRPPVRRPDTDPTLAADLAGILDDLEGIERHHPCSATRQAGAERAAIIRRALTAIGAQP